MSIKLGQLIGKVEIEPEVKARIDKAIKETATKLAELEGKYPEQVAAVRGYGAEISAMHPMGRWFNSGVGQLEVLMPSINDILDYLYAEILKQSAIPLELLDERKLIQETILTVKDSE